MRSQEPPPRGSSIKPDLNRPCPLHPTILFLLLLPSLSARPSSLSHTHLSRSRSPPLLRRRPSPARAGLPPPRIVREIKRRSHGGRPRILSPGSRCRRLPPPHLRWCQPRRDPAHGRLPGLPLPATIPARAAVPGHLDFPNLLLPLRSFSYSIYSCFLNFVPRFPLRCVYALEKACMYTDVHLLCVRTQWVCYEIDVLNFLAAYASTVLKKLVFFRSKPYQRIHKCRRGSNAKVTVKSIAASTDEAPAGLAGSTDGAPTSRDPRRGNSWQPGAPPSRRRRGRQHGSSGPGLRRPQHFF